MNYCAKIENSIVVEVIVADYSWAVANLAGDWHDLGAEPLTVGIGYTYNEVNDVFIPQGWTYDADTDTFSPPPPAVLDEFVTPEITEIVTEAESETPDETE
jgi:hypothetical protein